MTIKPHFITLPPDSMPKSHLAEATVRDILTKHRIAEQRHAQILYTFHDGIRDYCLTQVMEERGGQRRDVAEYGDVLRATVAALAELLGLSGSRFPLAAKAIIQEARMQERIPSGDYTHRLFEAFSHFAQAVSPIIVQVGKSPKGREGQHIRHVRFAAKFVAALRQLGVPVKTGRKSLATLLFCECLCAIGEPLSTDRAAGVLRDAAREQ